MHSPDFTSENIAKLAALFPGCVTESTDEDGNPQKAIDYDLLRQELSNSIVEGPQERYHLNWPGKKEALLTANAPIAKTLRPCREESVDFDTTENLFIEGDNLDALKLLQETYLGKVKMIYIDPPYNTGKDFIYSDNFAESAEEYLLDSGQKDEEGNRLVTNTDSNGRFHSDWLSMMYSRLKLARNLLKNDGVIFISIDDYENDNLKKLCDEIFGEKNYLSSLIWDKQHSQQQGLFKRYHEYVLVYAKFVESHENIKCGEGIIDAGALKKISKANPASQFTFPAGVRIEAEDGVEFSGTYGDSEQVSVVDGKLLAFGNITQHQVTLTAGWTQKEQMKQYFQGKDVYDSKGQKVIEFYFTSTGKLKCKKERSTITPSTILPKYGMVSAQSKALSTLMDGTFFDNPKPVEMIKTFCKWFTKDDIILDFFAGSATTAHAVMQLNAEDNGKRKFIMVQLPEACDEKSEAFKAGYPTIAEISKERIRRAGKKIKEENSTTASDLDTGFRVLKVDSSNMANVFYSPDTVEQSQLDLHTDNIKEDRSSEDLLFQVLLDWGVDLTLPITKETIDNREVFFVDDNALAACFEKSGNITEDFCKELARRQPLRVVFRDSGFKDDSVKINVEQIFKLMSPHTDLKTI